MAAAARHAGERTISVRCKIGPEYDTTARVRAGPGATVGSMTRDITTHFVTAVGIADHAELILTVGVTTLHRADTLAAAGITNDSTVYVYHAITGEKALGHLPGIVRAQVVRPAARVGFLRFTTMQSDDMHCVVREVMKGAILYGPRHGAFATAARALHCGLALDHDATGGPYIRIAVLADEREDAAASGETVVLPSVPALASFVPTGIRLRGIVEGDRPAPLSAIETALRVPLLATIRVIALDGGAGASLWDAMTPCSTGSDDLLVWRKSGGVAKLSLTTGAPSVTWADAAELAAGAGGDAAARADVCGVLAAAELLDVSNTSAPMVLTVHTDCTCRVWRVGTATAIAHFTVFAPAEPKGTEMELGGASIIPLHAGQVVIQANLHLSTSLLQAWRVRTGADGDAVSTEYLGGSPRDGGASEWDDCAQVVASEDRCLVYVLNNYVVQAVHPDGMRSLGKTAARTPVGNAYGMGRWALSPTGDVLTTDVDYDGGDEGGVLVLWRMPWAAWLRRGAAVCAWEVKAAETSD